MTDDAYVRRFDIEREVPREIWILETRRRNDGAGESGKWQPFEFPWQADSLGDPMDVNTEANIKKQIQHWNHCMRSAEWQLQGRLYTPAEIAWDDVDSRLKPIAGRIPGKVIHEDEAGS